MKNKKLKKCMAAMLVAVSVAGMANVAYADGINRTFNLSYTPNIPDTSNVYRQNFSYVAIRTNTTMTLIASTGGAYVYAELPGVYAEFTRVGASASGTTQKGKSYKATATMRGGQNLVKRALTARIVG